MSWTRAFAGEPSQGGVATFSPALLIGLLAGSYGLGCVATGYYLVRARTGQDIRRLGTGSTGARNVGRLLGSSGFVLTLAGDLAKGGVAVWLALALTGSHRVGLLALLAVVAGHVWPVQLGFQGGRGVATSLSGLLIYNPWFALIYCVVFAIIFAFSRRAIVSSLLTYVLLPLGCYLSTKDPAQGLDISILAVVVLIAHHSDVAEAINHLLRRRSLQNEAESPVKEL